MGINFVPLPGNLDTVTPNDGCDADNPDTPLQNYPVIISAVSSDGTTTIHGTLNSTANTKFTIEFFSNTESDATGYGEGQTYIGSLLVTTGAECTTSFTFTPPSPVAVG